MSKYDDILHLPHHVSRKHRQMAMIDRAAQFSPFAALTGYDAAIRETGRRTDTFVELEEDDKAVLDARLQVLQCHLSQRPVITITFFCPDAIKEGGSYECITGVVRRIDAHRRLLIMTDGAELSLDRIRGMEGEIFEQFQ